MNRNMQGNKCKLILPVLTSFVFIMILISCSGDSGGDNIDPAWEDKIKNILLRSEGWVLEFKDYSENSGVSDLTFEDRGDKFIVKIVYSAWNIKCERKVTFTSEGFKMAGCTLDFPPLIFDPNDQRYPFKGVNSETTVKVGIP